MTTHTGRQKRPAAFFDLDLTLTDQDSFRLFLKTWYFAKPSRFVYLPCLLFFGILRKLRLISLIRFKEKALIGLKGLPLDEIRDIGNTFFETSVKPFLREKAMKQVAFHRAAGEPVFIISASPDIYVHAVCRYLGCRSYMATQLSVKDNGFTGKFSNPDCLGLEKQKQLLRLVDLHGIDLELSCSYSDHEADLPFLESTGKTVAVTPTRKLHDIAVARGWAVAEW